jgi:hypothetical protein
MDVGQNITFRTRRPFGGADRPRVARTDSKTKEGAGGSSLHATAPADESGRRPPCECRLARKRQLAQTPTPHRTVRPNEI